MPLRISMKITVHTYEDPEGMDKATKLPRTYYDPADQLEPCSVLKENKEANLKLTQYKISHIDSYQAKCFKGKTFFNKSYADVEGRSSATLTTTEGHGHLTSILRELDGETKKIDTLLVGIYEKVVSRNMSMSTESLVGVLLKTYPQTPVSDFGKTLVLVCKKIASIEEKGLGIIYTIGIPLKKANLPTLTKIKEVLKQYIKTSFQGMCKVKSPVLKPSVMKCAILTGNTFDVLVCKGPLAVRTSKKSPKEVFFHTKRNGRFPRPKKVEIPFTEEDRADILKLFEEHGEMEQQRTELENLIAIVENESYEKEY